MLTVDLENADKGWCTVFFVFKPHSRKIHYNTISDTNVIQTPGMAYNISMSRAISSYSHNLDYIVLSSTLWPAFESWTQIKLFLHRVWMLWWLETCNLVVEITTSSRAAWLDASCKVQQIKCLTCVACRVSLKTKSLSSDLSILQS